MARSHFNWVLENHPNSEKAPDALLSLAAVDRREKPKLAAKLLTDVTVRYPKSPQARVAKLRLAEFYNNRREYGQAIALAQAVREDSAAPEDIKASAAIREAEGRLGMWRCRGGAENLQRGVALLEEVPRKYPGLAKQVGVSQIQLAMYYINSRKEVPNDYYRHDPAKARAILQDALATQPHSECLWWMRSEIVTSYTAEKRWQEALAECTSALADGPPLSWRSYFLFTKGDLQLRLDQTQEATATLQQLITDHPASDWAKLATKRLEPATQPNGGEQK